MNHAKAARKIFAGPCEVEYVTKCIPGIPCVTQIRSGCQAIVSLETGGCNGKPLRSPLSVPSIVHTNSSASTESLDWLAFIWRHNSSDFAAGTKCQSVTSGARRKQNVPQSSATGAGILTKILASAILRGNQVLRVMKCPVWSQRDKVESPMVGVVSHLLSPS